MPKLKIPPERELSREELQKNINRVRKIAPRMSKASLPPKHVFGKEYFLHTKEGIIRILLNSTDSSKIQPLYVNIHGGGFTMGMPENDDKYCQMIAEKIDVKVVNISYSLSPEKMFPQALNECYEVIAFVKTHCDEFGIDPERIVAGGHSAGGNLSAAVAIMDGAENKLRLKGVLMTYPPMDIYTDAFLKDQPKGCIPPKMARISDACYLQPKEARKNPLVSPVFASTDQVKSFPPTLIITASGDLLCAEGDEFKDLLVEAGVDVTYKRFDTKHGFTHYESPYADEAWRMILNHLEKCLLARDDAIKH